MTPSEHLIETPDDFRACIEYLATCRVIGFDTEFVGEDYFVPKLCLIQAATEDRLFIIDPLAVDPEPFWRLFEDPTRLAIIHAGREELRMCRRGIGQTPASFFDVQVAAGMVGMGYPVSHANLVYDLLHQTLDKSETLTDWRQRPLQVEQLRYAFDDVRYLIALWRKLTAQLESLNRTDWNHEEQQRFLGTALRDIPVQEKWRKLRGLGGLDRRKLAIVREISVWREEQAERLNRPVSTILREDLIGQIARRNSAREKDIAGIRGIAGNQVPGIVAAVARAKALPFEECPVAGERDDAPPQTSILISLLQTFLADYCVRQRLTPAMTATTSDLRAVVLAEIGGSELPAENILASGWRSQTLLPELQALLRGEKSLLVGDVRSLTPLKSPRTPAK